MCFLSDDCENRSTMSLSSIQESSQRKVIWDKESLKPKLIDCELINNYSDMCAAWLTP